MLVKNLVNSNSVKNCLVVLILALFYLNSVCIAKDSHNSVSNKTANQEKTVNKNGQGSARSKGNQTASSAKSNSDKKTADSSDLNKKEEHPKKVKDSTASSAKASSDKKELSSIDNNNETDKVLNTADNLLISDINKSIDPGNQENSEITTLKETDKAIPKDKENFAAISHGDTDHAPPVSGNSDKAEDVKTETADKASAVAPDNADNSEVLKTLDTNNTSETGEVAHVGTDQNVHTSPTKDISASLSYVEPESNNDSSELSSTDISGTDKSIGPGNQENENSEITKTSEIDEAISIDKENSAASSPVYTDHAPVSGNSDMAEDPKTETADKASAAASDNTDNSEVLKTLDTNNTSATGDVANVGTEQPVHTSQPSNEFISTTLSRGEMESNNNEDSVLSRTEKSLISNKSHLIEIVLGYISLIAILFVFWVLLNRSIKLSVKRECEKIAADAFKSIDEKKTSLELYEQVCGILLHSSDNSHKLFEKYIELSQSKSDVTNSNDTDNQALLDEQHEIVKLVANRICFMKVSLSRMDPSVKGYKQLKKSIDQIFDNLMAKGYEIIDYLGMPYNEGMKVTASFIPDEDLPEGQRIVTGVIKPQVNYQNEMIQAAQITVSQNID